MSEPRPWYRLHLWSILVAVCALLFAVVQFLLGTGRVSFSSKHLEFGWPLVYRTEHYRDNEAFGPAIGTPGNPAPKPAERYELLESTFNPLALAVDAGLGALVILVPTVACEWFLRRRKRG